MTKEEKKHKKTNGLFKIFTMAMLVGALWLVHAEYMAGKMHHRVESSKPAHVIDVNIETGENAVVDEEKPYEKGAKSLDEEIAEFVSEDFAAKPSGEEKLEHYRLHLANVARLVEKFSQNVDYDHELEFLLSRGSEYTPEIGNILHNAKEYRDTYLTSADEEYTKLSLEGGFATRMVDKIVDIKKKNPEHALRAEKYDMLKKQMDDLMEYFYSKEFLKKYLGND